MNLTQLPVKFEEAVSPVLMDITPEMKNSFCNILKELFSLTLEMPGNSTIPVWNAWVPIPGKPTGRHSLRKWTGQRQTGETIFRAFSGDNSL